MTRKEIFSHLGNAVSDKMDCYYKIQDDHINFIRMSDSNSLEIPFRCQNYGDLFVLSSMGARLTCPEIEIDFKKYLIKELLEVYSPEYTIVADKKLIKSMSSMIGFQVRSDDDIKLYATKIISYIREVEDYFLDEMSKVENIGKYISGFPFSQRDEVFVGSLFPVQLLKKIYFLRNSGNLVRYKEYKEGLESLLIRYEEKKINKADKAKIFWKGYKHFIDKLEGDATTVLT